MFSIKKDSLILIYTGLDIAPYFDMLIEAGASGIISKTSCRKELLAAIRCAFRGKAEIPISLLRQLRRKQFAFPFSEENNINLDNSITEREHLVLKEVARGRSNKEIAAELRVSQRTVEYDLTRIFSKLNVKTRLEAIKVAEQLGLINKDMVL